MGDGGTLPPLLLVVDQVVVRAPPVLDRETSGAFRREAFDLLDARLGASPGARLVVDLSDSATLDSAGVGVLVALQRRAAELRCTVCLRGASEELRFLLVLTRLEDRFEYEPPAA